MAINALLGIGGDQSGKVHLFDGEKLAWRTITIPPDPSAEPAAAQPSAAAIRSISRRAISSLPASGQSSTPAAVTR